MTSVSFQGNPIPVSGSFPAVGTKAKAFELAGADLSNVNLASFAGKRVVLNIFPSIDTGTCAQSVRQFNQRAATLNNTEVVCVSADLPFAASRFCELEGIEHVQHLSVFRSRNFTIDYGVAIAVGPMEGLTARAVVVIDEQGTVIHSELVADLAAEPNYDAALAVL